MTNALAYNTAAWVTPSQSFLKAGPTFLPSNRILSLSPLSRSLSLFLNLFQSLGISSFMQSML